MSYRQSHMAPGRGEAYDGLFKDNPHRRMIWEFEKQILDDIVMRFLGKRSFSYLDFACGTGRILGHVGRHTTNAVGVDVSASMINVARANLPLANLVLADLTTDDALGDVTFDLVTAFRFFPNAEADLRVLAMRAIKRHLAPTGYFVFNNHKSTESLRNRAARLLGRRGFQGMSRRDVSTLLAKAGFCLVKTYHLSTFPASERRSLLPIRMVACIESLTRRIPALGAVSENLIFVCRHA